jgi:hypothetical protein
MMKHILKIALSKVGNELLAMREKPTSKNGHSNQKKESSGFVLYRYVKPNGSFDYERYRSIQEQGNKTKIDQVWVIEENIAFLADYLRKQLSDIKFGICHGTRRGKEQEWFRKYLRCEVIGTELSETAKNFPHTICWDFHNTKPEWIGKVDFIYSNSFDHSYDPESCLNTWMRCLRVGGFCIIEHTSSHAPKAADELDPFGADIVQMPYLITKWGRGDYGVRQLLDAPVKLPVVDYNVLIAIQKF